MGDSAWQQKAYAHTRMIQASSSLHGNIIKDYGRYDMEELDQALFPYLNGQDQSSSSVQEQPQTLNIFPSQPMHVEPSPKESMTNLPANVAGSSKLLSTDEPSKPASTEPLVLGKDGKATIKKERRSGKEGSTTLGADHEGPKTRDPKTLRRLAQNREAARKSRLRKKAYIQQLETSRIRLSYLEQEVQRSGTQGMSDHSTGIGGLSPDAAMFNVKYWRWWEEHQNLVGQLRAAEEHAPDDQLRLCVLGTTAHYGSLMQLRALTARSDALHLLSGAWLTAGEHCFLWIGGFRPSELIKVIARHVEPLTEQQILSIYEVQQAAKKAEDTLEDGLYALQSDLSDIISSDAHVTCSSSAEVAGYMGHMYSIAMAKLNSLQGFVVQADKLRLQTLHKLPEILTTRQSARCFVAIADYFHRLRGLSELSAARPRQENASSSSYNYKPYLGAIS